MNATQLEQAVLGLPPEERVHLALVAWESLENDPVAAGDCQLDPEGTALAVQRDLQIGSGAATPISHHEFRQRTGGSDT